MNLKDLIEKYNLPEPDDYYEHNGYEKLEYYSGIELLTIYQECGDVYISVEKEHTGWTKPIKTDSDWELVATFIRFLKG